MPNILDSIKGVGLSAGIGFVALLYPPIKPLIDKIQEDVKEGKVTVDNFEGTLREGVKFVEGFTPDDVDAFLEQCLVVVHECIKAEQLGVIAFAPKQ